MGQVNQPTGTGFPGGLYVNLPDGTYVPVVDENGNIDAPVTTTDLTTTGNTTLGNAATDTLTVNGVSTFTAGATTDAVNITGTAITTGKALEVIDLAALTSGIGISVTSAATAITGAGRLFSSSHSGATGTSAILNEFASAATDETIITKVTASAALAAGKALQVSAAAMTTGTAVDVPGLDALTSGKGVHVSSAATAMTSGGRLLHVNHTGATSTSGVLAEIASAATDETVISQVTASGALAAGKALSISGAAVTTGTLLDISDNTAQTTGTAVNVVTNSADTGTRSVVFIKQDHASATGATPLEVVNDSTLACIKATGATQATHFQKILKMGSGPSLWASDGTTANGNLSGTAGDICFNAGSNKPEYCTSGTSWTALV